MPRPTRSALLSSLVLCLGSASAAQAAPKTFSADGNAVMAAGGKDAAVQQATHAAEVQALVEALESLGAPTEEAESLLEQHRGELLKSAQAREPAVDGNIVTVRVTAGIDTAALASLTGARPGKGGTAGRTGKRVLILASEQLGPREVIAWTDYAFGWSPTSVSMSSKTKLFQLVDEMGGLEATLSTAFTDAGFDVIDPKVLRGKLSKPALEAVDLTTAQAQSIAQKGDADVVLVVKGKADLVHNQVIPESGMYSGSGNVVARAIRVRDGKVLSASTQQAAKVHIDLQTARILALNEAAKLASADLLRKLNAD